jgi:hypothetical protein
VTEYKQVKFFVASLPFRLMTICASLAMPAAAQAGRVVVDFPVPTSTQPAAEWLSGPVTEWEEPASRRIDVPVAAAGTDHRIIATMVFEEKPGDAIRIWFEPDVPGELIPLPGTWTDGIQGWNQKSVLVPSELVREGGNLVFETAGSSRRIQRLILTRLDRGTWFAPGGLALQEFFRLEGETKSSEELGGQAWSMPPDAWNGNVIEAHLQEFTESARGGVEFVVEISPAPSQGVLRFELVSPAIAPPGVWVNGKQLPHVSVEIPPLRSPAIVQTTSGAGPLFPGWRKAWAHIPPGVLVAGENQFLISSGPQETFIRRARAEMWFAAPVLPAVLPPETFPDVFSETLDDLPPSPGPADPEPALPAWDPAKPPALDTIPAPADWFRTSLR